MPETKFSCFFARIYRHCPGDIVGKGVFESSLLNLYSYGVQNPIIYTDPDGNRPSLVVFASMSIAYSSAYASFRLAHGSQGGAIISGSSAAIAAGFVTFFDPSNKTVLAAPVIGAAFGNWGGQVFDIVSRHKNDFSYGEFFGAIGGGFFSGYAMRLAKLADAGLKAQGLLTPGKELLNDILFSTAFEIPGSFGEYIGMGIEDTYNIRLKLPELKYENKPVVNLFDDGE